MSQFSWWSSAAMKVASVMVCGSLAGCGGAATEPATGSVNQTGAAAGVAMPGMEDGGAAAPAAASGDAVAMPDTAATDSTLAPDSSDAAATTAPAGETPGAVATAPADSTLSPAATATPAVAGDGTTTPATTAGDGTTPQGDNAGGGQPAAPQPPPKTDILYPLFMLAQFASQGDYAAANEILSTKSKGLLAAMREGSLTEEQIAELKEQFKNVELRGVKASGTNKVYTVQNANRDILSITVGKEGPNWVIKEFKVQEAPKK